MSKRAGENDGRPGQRPDGIPGLVWWITALHVTLLVAYSMLLPTYQAPDEPQHTDLAHLFSEELRYPPWDERDLDPGITRSQEVIRFEDRSRTLTVDEAFPKDQVPSLEDLSESSVETTLNYMPQHPPLYYSVVGGAGWIVKQATGGSLGGFVFENWFYRMVSLLFVAPLPLIIWQITRRLSLPEPVAVAATLVPLAVPQLFHNGSAVNNDTLMLLLFWLLTPVVLRVAAGDLTRRTAMLAGTLTGLAMLTKGFGLVLPLWVLATLLVAARRQGREHHRAVIRSGLVYGATCMVIGGWWWVRNIVLYGQLSPSRFKELYPGPRDPSFQLGTWLHEWVVTTRRFWGDFGWYFVTQIPDEVIIVATAVCLVALVAACRRTDSVARTLHGDRLLLAAPLFMLIALQGAISFRGYVQTGRIGGMQGRYWFGALAAFAVVVALGLAGMLKQLRRYRWLGLGIVVAAALMHGLAVRSILEFHWAYPDAPLAERFQTIVAWGPLPGKLLGVVTAVGLVPLLVVPVRLVALARSGAGRPSPVDRGDDDADEATSDGLVIATQ